MCFLQRLLQLQSQYFLNILPGKEKSYALENPVQFLRIHRIQLIPGKLARQRFSHPLRICPESEPFKMILCSWWQENSLQYPFPWSSILNRVPIILKGCWTATYVCNKSRYSLLLLTWCRICEYEYGWICALFCSIWFMACFIPVLFSHLLICLIFCPSTN